MTRFKISFLFSSIEDFLPENSINEYLNNFWNRLVLVGGSKMCFSLKTRLEREGEQLLGAN